MGQGAALPWELLTQLCNKPLILTRPLILGVHVTMFYRFEFSLAERKRVEIPECHHSEN